MQTCGRVNCGPKVADRKRGPVGKMRTLILQTLGLLAKRNEWLTIKCVLFDRLLFALLCLYFTVLPKNRPGQS